MTQIETFFTTGTQSELIAKTIETAKMGYTFADDFVLSSVKLFHTIPCNCLTTPEHIRLNGWLALTTVSVFCSGGCYYTCNGFSALGEQKVSPVLIKAGKSLDVELKFPESFFSDSHNTILIGCIVSGHIYRKVAP